MTITIDRVSKRYRLQGEAPRTFQHALAQFLGFVRGGRTNWVLGDVSLVIKPGETVGLVGHNGAGKSTLLRLMCGLGRPTDGRIQIEGRVAALLDLASGFHPNLTGRENVFVTGVVSGLRRAEVAARFDQIVAFAEIGAYIDQPLRTYSMGMQLRLAFAVAIHVEPDILIIDEALAVGDKNFQQKCLARIESFCREGKTLVIVSHDLQTIQRFCTRVIWLRHGQIGADGPAEEVIALYERSGTETIVVLDEAPSLVPDVERRNRPTV